MYRLGRIISSVVLEGCCRMSGPKWVVRVVCWWLRLLEEGDNDMTIFSSVRAACCSNRRISECGGGGGVYVVVDIPSWIGRR